MLVFDMFQSIPVLSIQLEKRRNKVVAAHNTHTTTTRSARVLTESEGSGQASDDGDGVFGVGAELEQHR